jgi:PAS domain S-box-containing protein
MEEIFIKIVDRIPISMQYPEIACSRLISDGKEYRSKKFLVSKWKLSSDILINSNKTGSIEIAYLDDHPAVYEEPFLKEEGDLINAIAEILSGFIERKQTEKAKKQAHAELEAIFNTAGGGMRVIDKDFNVLKINTPFTELVGLSMEELTDQKCYEQFPGPYCHTSDCTMNRILNGEERVDNEVIKTCKDGSKIPTMLIATPLKNENGEFIGLVEDFKDITERIHAEESSKQASTEFATIFNAAGDGMRVVGIDYSVLRANKAFAEIVGLNETELIGQKCFEQFWHEYCKTPLCTLQRIIEGAEFIEIEAVKQHSDGTKVIVIITATPFRNADGELSGVVEVFKDITLRKQTEKDLRESEEKYRLLFKSPPYSIILLDINGDISDCNQITEKYLALSRDEIIGKTIDEFNLISEMEKKLILTNVQELIDIKITEPKEFEFINENRERIWLENIFSYVKIGGNDYIQILSSDITERKKIESIIKQELEKLKELDKLKSEFVLRASHELKTPLNSVYSASTILLNYYQTYLDERGKRLIKIINKGGERLKNLIVDLIDVSQIESGGISIEKKFEDLRKIVEECVNVLYYSFIERELFINVEITGDFLIKVNKTKIEQVIINILSNAIKNTPPRGKIAVKLLKYDEYIDIKIQDNGVGFTEEEKEKLFKKFGKIERYGKGMNIVTEGTGLGLFISKELIELHGGKIWVESRGRHEGSTFTIRLPILN